MRTVVTGSAGRIGQAVVKALAAAGHDVIGLDQRLCPELKNIQGVQQAVIDLLDRPCVYDRFAGAEALVHLGNHPHVRAVAPHRVLPENTAMNSHAFEAAVEHGVRRIVFASSIQAISGSRTLAGETIAPSPVPSLPLTADTPINPTNGYGLSKVAGEMLLKLHVRDTPDLAAVAVRLPWTHPGPIDGFRRFDLDDARERGWGKHMYLDEGFSWIDLDDAADLFRTLLERMKPGYDCVMPASDDNHTNLTADQIAATYFPGTPVVGELSEYSVIDGSDLSRKYGWTPQATRQDDAAPPA